MSTVSVHSQTATDGELAKLIVAALHGTVPQRWLFVEGPARSEFIDPPHTLDPSEIERLWQVRLFHPGAELAARRRNFDDTHPWSVRWIGAQPPGGGWESQEEFGKTGAAEKLYLYGKATASGEFLEHRFGRRELRYPGISAPADAEVSLEVRTLDSPGGSIVWWQRLVRKARPRAPRGRGQA